MTSDLLVGLFVDVLFSQDGFVLHDGSNDVVRRLGGVVVAKELDSLVHNWLEEFGNELPLASFPDNLQVFPPHVDDGDILESGISTEPAEVLEVALWNPSQSSIGNPVNVYDSYELGMSLAPDQTMSERHG